jgi:hypothetical protein
MPCITLRDTTEWDEMGRDGGHVLVEAVRHFSPSGKRSMVFGEIGAAGRIAGDQ